LKHTVPVTIDAHVLQTFHATWVRGACQKTFWAKINWVWAKGASNNLGHPIYFCNHWS